MNSDWGTFYKTGLCALKDLSVLERGWAIVKETEDIEQPKAVSAPGLDPKSKEQIAIKDIIGMTGGLSI